MAAWMTSSLPSMFNRLLGANNNVVDPPTMERYLELATECLGKLQKMTSSLQCNHGLCHYLGSKLVLAIQIAQECASTRPRYIEWCYGSFKLLYRLAKEIENFTDACCTDQWIRFAIMFTNVSEYVTLVGSELDFCRMIFRNANSGSEMLTMIGRVSSTEVETETVRLRAMSDQYKLWEKVKALVESSDASAPEYRLAAFLLGRLTAAPTKCIAVDLSSPNFWEVDYGDLEQQDKVGAGSAGVVHRSIWLGERVAEKIFFGSDPSFKNEVLILAGLSHPNVVPLFCYAMDNAQCSIVMELMDEDLLSLMRRRKRQDRTCDCPFTIPEAVDIILQVADGVNYLHRNKVVHRGLKSQNIMVKGAKDGDMAYLYAKVADFGLSKTKETSTTFTNQTLNTGTTRWMAPEIMLRQVGGKKYPFKIDVYSFAMVCYEILTGEVPFQATRNPNEVRDKVLAGQRPDIPQHCPDYLKSLIQECWEADPVDRPNFGAICSSLRHLNRLLMLEERKVLGVGRSCSATSILGPYEINVSPW